MLQANNISCAYGKEIVLEQASFTVEKGETLCIIGANGSGKTTLLHALMGLHKTSGQIQICEKSIGALSSKDRAKEMALLSQHSSIEFPYTIWDTVALGRYCHKKNCFAPLSGEEKNLIDQCIQDVGLWNERESMISSLSGGQLQRVYLARTFAQNPRIILLDEPTNHLDLKVQLDLFHRLKTWVGEENRCVIGVFHDLNFVRQFADKVLLLHKGHTLAYGSVEDVMTREHLQTAFHIDVWDYMETSYGKWASR